MKAILGGLFIGVGLWCFHYLKTEHLRREINRLRKRHAEIVKELYGQGLEVAYFHMNDDLDPLDSWFEQNDWLDD